MDSLEASFAQSKDQRLAESKAFQYNIMTELTW